MYRENITPCDDPRDCYYRDFYRGGFSGCRILTPKSDKNGNNTAPYEPYQCKFYKPADWKEGK